MKKTDICSIVLFVVGAVMTVFGFILGYVIFPAVVEKLIREELDLWNMESEGRHNFVRRLFVKLGNFLLELKNSATAISQL
jgi:hypothetical protein